VERYGGTTRRCRREASGGGRSLMGEVVPRCGAGSLVKIVVQESICQGVMGVQFGASSRRRVRESSMCPSAYPCEEKLQ
jgi:hypothetical protein